jgi:predicted nucleotidyltransferase
VPADIKRVLAELKEGLSTLYGERLRRVYVYGSYARGDYQEGSDLDVLIVLKDFERAPIEMERTDALMGELSLEYLITISPLFMREDDWLNADKPLLRNVRVEGVPV